MARVVTPSLLLKPTHPLGDGPLFASQRRRSGNPTWSPTVSSADWSLSNNNFTALRTSTGGGFWGLLLANIGFDVGSFVVNIDAAGTGTGPVYIGFDTGAETQFPGQEGSGRSIGIRSDGSVFIAATTVATYASYTTGDQIRVDKAGVFFTFYKNGVLQGTVDSTPNSGTLLAGIAYPTASNGNGTGTQLSLTSVATFVSHDTTGALTGPGSTIAGTAVYNAVHPTTGVLTGPGSTIVGSAARTREHATTGALVGPGTTLAGVAVYNAKHATSGVLTGQGSTIVGSATRFRAHATTGALVGPGSVIVGVAVYNAKHSTTGALIGPGSTLAGSATRFRTFATSGVLVGPGSTIAGAADHASRLSTHATSGALVGQPSIITGTAARTRVHATSGVLTGPPSLVVGYAARWRDHGSSGVLLGVTSVVFARVFNGTPELQDIPVDSDNLVNEASPPSEDLGPISEPSGQIVNHPPYPAA